MYNSKQRLILFCIAAPMLLLLLLPVFGLLFASSPADLLEGMKHPLFTPALWLSAQTTVFSLFIILLLGTPLAWWQATTSHTLRHTTSLIVDLPIVLPPAVVGIALLHTFGRQGILAPLLLPFNIQIPFTTTAVIIAQVVVSAPFYIQAASAAFLQLDKELLLVARTLGHAPLAVFFKVALPLALPSLISGAALSFARALGEFGATLLFAGNLSTITQTIPLAIYMSLESDMRVALAFSLILSACAIFLLLSFRKSAHLWSSPVEEPLSRSGY